MLNGDLSFSDNFLDSDFSIEDLDYKLDDLLSDPDPASNSDSTDHHSSLSQPHCVYLDQSSVNLPPKAEGFSPALAVQGLNVDDTINPDVDLEYGFNDRDSSGHSSYHDSHSGGCDFAKASNYHQSSVSDSN